MASISKKIISFILIFAIFISCFGVSSYADPISEITPNSLYWALGLEYVNQVVERTANECFYAPSGSDGYHHFVQLDFPLMDPDGNVINYECEYCHEQISDAVIDLAYQASIAASGFSGVSSGSDGYLYMYINEFTHTVTSGNNVVSANTYTYPSSNSNNVWRFYYQTVAPITGIYYYSNYTSYLYSISRIGATGSISNYSSTSRSLSLRSVDSVSLSSENYINYSISLTAGSPLVLYSECFSGPYFSMTATFSSPSIIRITPTGTVSTSTNITNNITTVYSGNNTYNNIVNTTTNQYYDVGTDELIDILSWQFDYMNREYTLQLDRLTDSLVKVKFGLDNLTVEAGTTINNYYYGYDECEPSPSHTHTWTSTVVNERTCTIPGITTYTCEECNQTYTDTVPAIGHIWDSGVHHDAVIDPETEEVTTPGYTTYTCTVCGATQDVTDGSPPPSSAENSDVWWDKLLKWLADFKTDLFNKLDNLNISDDDTTNITIEGNDFTFNEGDDEDSFSFQNDFLAKFGVIKDLWDVGQYVVNIVSEDAANAYSFDINDALSVSPESSPASGG